MRKWGRNFIAKYVEKICKNSKNENGYLGNLKVMNCKDIRLLSVQEVGKISGA